MTLHKVLVVCSNLLLCILLTYWGNTKTWIFSVAGYICSLLHMVTTHLWYTSPYHGPCVQSQPRLQPAIRSSVERSRSIAPQCGHLPTFFFVGFFFFSLKVWPPTLVGLWHSITRRGSINHPAHSTEYLLYCFALPFCFSKGISVVDTCLGRRWRLSCYQGTSHSVLALQGSLCGEGFYPPSIVIQHYCSVEHNSNPYLLSWPILHLFQRTRIVQGPLRRILFPYLYGDTATHQHIPCCYFPPVEKAQFWYGDCSHPIFPIFQRWQLLHRTTVRILFSVILA